MNFEIFFQKKRSLKFIFFEGTKFEIIKINISITFLWENKLFNVWNQINN